MSGIKLPLISITFLIIQNAVGTNVPSQVMELNDQFFQVKNEGLWFVMFFAPWCAHCKRLLPVWEQLGHVLADRESPVRISKLDCTRFTRTASALNVRGYPTLIFFRHGKELYYDSERDKESLLAFVLKASGPVIGAVQDVREFSELRRNAKEPFFVYVKGDEVLPHEVFNDYEKIAEALFTSIKFYRATRDVFPKAIRLPNTSSVIVFKDGSHLIYKPEDGKSLENWIYSERWSLMPLVTSTNLRDVGRMRLLVLSVINMVERRNETSPVGRFHSILVKVAKTVNADTYLSYFFQFGWLDGSAIANNVVLGTVSQPGLLVFNVSSYEYYQNGDAPSVMTEGSIISFLERIVAGDVKPLGGRSFLQRIRRLAYEFLTNIMDMFKAQPLLTICLFGVPFSFLSLITYCICSTDFSVDREEIYPDDEGDSDLSDANEHSKEE